MAWLRHCTRMRCGLQNGGYVTMHDSSIYCCSFDASRRPASYKVDEACVSRPLTFSTRPTGKHAASRLDRRWLGAVTVSGIFTG